MKIKEVCQKTDLTERTVRFYIEKGLLQPISSETNKRIYYDFYEQDIAKLNKIATFRKIGFSIDVIADMEKDQENIDMYLTSHISAIKGKQEMYSGILKTLKNIEGKHFTSTDDLAESLHMEVADMPLPLRDIKPNFGRFDSESKEEKEEAYLDFLLHQRINDKFSKILRPFKTALKIIIAAAAVFLLAFTLSCIPKEIDQKYLGTDFRVGESGTGENVSIYIRGKLYNRLLEEEIFKGNIELDTVDYSHNSEVELHFHNGIKSSAWLVYHGLKTQGFDTVPVLYSFANIWTDKNFNYIIFHCFDKLDETSSILKNRVICAPAKNIEEGLQLLEKKELLEEITKYGK